MNLYSKLKRLLLWCDLHGKLLMQFSFILVYLTLLIIHINAGFVFGMDSGWYVDNADQLIRLNFNFFDYYHEQVNHSPPLYFYTTLVFVIAILKLLFSEYWQVSFFSLNLILLLSIQWLIAKCLLLCGVRNSLVAVTMPLLLISADFLTWPRYLLSDMLFAWFVMLFVYYSLRARLSQKSFAIPIMVVGLFTAVTRPTSLPILVSLPIILFLPIFFPGVTKTRMLAIILSVSVVLGSLIYGIFFGSIYQLDWGNTQLDHIWNWMRDGTVIGARPETWLAPPTLWFEISELFLIRFFAFFSPIAQTFSIYHNAANVLLLGIFLSGLMTWFGLREMKTKQLDEVAWIILVLVVVVSCFHSATQIDWEWRYRFPIIAPLMVYSIVSWEYLVRRLLHEGDP